MLNIFWNKFIVFWKGIKDDKIKKYTNIKKILEILKDEIDKKNKNIGISFNNKINYTLSPENINYILNLNLINFRFQINCNSFSKI